jgi:hypothetical protein
MEPKMATGTGLTPQQEQLLDLALKEQYFLNTFYLSGGTALSTWYLHHRESYDLDFFSIVPFDYDRIIRWFRQNKLNEKIDPLQLAKNFLKATEYTDFPKMLVAFDDNKMFQFYEDLAKSLKTQNFEITKFF